MNYELYVIDTETTGLDSIKNSPIEISIYRLSNGNQKTWHLKPVGNIEDVQPEALRVNGLKLEDLQGFTKEGRDLYQEPSKVLIEIENWLMEDGMRSEERVMVGQNVDFDKQMVIRLWEKLGSSGTFPFSQKRSLDTMSIQFCIDLAKGSMDEGYSLKNLTKRYNIINSKAHSAEADTRATAEVFQKQITFLREKLNN